MKLFKWLPQHDVAIKKNRNSKCSDVLRHTLHNVRHDLFHKGIRPNWIPPHVMDELERIWTTEAYKAKSDIAKVNPASSTGGTQHKGGSIDNSEHKRRLASMLGRTPTLFELFTKTHYDEKTSEFVDQRSAEVSEHYMRIKASRSSNMDSPSVQSNELEEEEMNLYLEAIGGKNKKGRIYGLGSEAQDIDSTHYSHMTSPSVNTVLQPDIENVVTELRQENANLQEQNANLQQQHANLQQQHELILTRLEAIEHKLSRVATNSDADAND